MPSKPLNIQRLKNIANEYLDKYHISGSPYDEKFYQQKLREKKKKLSRKGLKLSRKGFIHFEMRLLKRTDNNLTAGHLVALDLLNMVEELEKSNNRSAEDCAEVLLSLLSIFNVLRGSYKDFGDTILRLLEDHYDIQCSLTRKSPRQDERIEKGLYYNPLRLFMLKKYLRSQDPSSLCRNFSKFCQAKEVTLHDLNYSAGEFIAAVKSELLRAAKNGEINKKDIPNVKKVLAYHSNSASALASKARPIKTIKTQSIKRSLEDIEIFTNLYCNKLLPMSYKQLVTKYNEIKKGDNGLYGNSKNRSLKAIKHVLMNKLENEKTRYLDVSVSEINKVIDHHIGEKKWSNIIFKKDNNVETAARERVNKNNMLKSLLNTKGSTENYTFNHQHSMFEL